MKTVIVTGASGNMGKAVVNKFLNEGYRVIGTAVSNDPAATDVDHKNFEKRVADLASEDDVAKLTQTIIEKYQTIDVLVCTVGGFATGNLAATQASHIYDQYKLNFETAYNIARPVFLHMLKQANGRIFLVGSRPGIAAKNGKGMIAYGLAKSLIFRLAELMNEEAKGKNVVTSVLVPSTIDTPQNRKSMPDADFTAWVKAEAIADSIWFYCTAEAAALREPVIKLYNNA